MTIDKKINDHTTLVLVEPLVTYFDTQRQAEQIDSYRLIFSFYDCTYQVFVSRKRIDEDFPCVEMEGESKLFDSFERACEDEHWELIKSTCNEYDKQAADEDIDVTH